MFIVISDHLSLLNLTQIFLLESAVISQANLTPYLARLVVTI